jgi:hypothetical protein
VLHACAVASSECFMTTITVEFRTTTVLLMTAEADFGAYWQ